MDGQARPNVAVQLGSECVQRCGCSAECCQRLMGGGGHIVSAPTKQEGASRASVHMQGLCDLAQCTWCRLGGGWTQSSTQTFQWCTKHPWGLVWRCVCVGGRHGGLVVAGASWGCGKNVVNLTQCLGTCGAPTYLQGVTQGEWVPAECLSRSVIIMYKSKYIHRGLYLSRSEKKAAFSSYSSLALYNRQVMWRKELNKKAVTRY